MENRTKTVVINLMDGRTSIYDLPPDRAVMAAFEEQDNLDLDSQTFPSPDTLSNLKEYRRGFACGDWVAYKPDTLQ